MSLLSLGDVLDGYRLDDVIGRGGMGTVYRGTDLSLNKTVAVKIVAADLGANRKFADRFRVEAQALGRLSHPGVVRVLAFREVDAVLMLVMEYVSGPSLAAFISRNAPVASSQALPLFRQIADAVRHAHDGGVLHRDLKPSNILLTPEGRPKITDFGLARIVAEDVRLTSTHERAGTTAYMAPEQIRGLRRVGRQTDLFALGLVFFEVLTGRLPYSLSGGSFEIQQRILEAEFPPPSQFAASVPSEVDDLVADLLRKEPDDRPAGMEAVVQRLQTVSTQLDVDDQSLALPLRSSREPSRRSRSAIWTWGIAAGVVALLIAGVLTVLSPEAPLSPMGVQDAGTHLHLTSDPPGARATIDGNPVGETPLDQFHPGEDTVQVTLRMNEYAPLDTQLVGPGSVRLAATLTPVADELVQRSVVGPDTAFDPSPPSNQRAEAESPDPAEAVNSEPVQPGASTPAESGDLAPAESDTARYRTDPRPVATPTSPDVPPAEEQPLPARLSIRIAPEGDVYLNDSLVSQSARSTVVDSLAPGDYEVLVTSALGRLRKQIQLAAGASVQQDIDFREQVDLSVIAQTPAGAPIPNAAVFVDGTPRGYTPQRMSIRVGERRVRVEREGYAASERLITVEPGMRSLVVVEMDAGR